MTSGGIFTRAQAESESVFDPGSGFHDTLLVSGDEMQLVWAKLEPDRPYPMHSHPFDQISLLVEGRLRLTVGNKTHVIGPGDMWHAPSGVLHGGDVLGGRPVVFVDIYGPASESVAARFATRRPPRRWFVT